MHIKHSKAGAIAATLAAGSVLWSAGAAADSVSNQDLDQRIRILERKLEIEKEAAEAKAKATATPSASEKGYGIKLGDYEFKFNGLVQFDGRWFSGDTVAQTSDTFLLRRLRPTFQGSLGKLVSWRLTPEFAGGNSTSVGNATIVDAYFDLNFDPAASLRVGKFKSPVGLERLQSGGAITFVERGLPTELVSNRDIGIQLQGAFADKTLSYAIGYFNGTRDGADANDNDNDGRKEVAARIFYEPTPGIGFGIAGSYGNKRGGAETPRSYSTPDRISRISYQSGTVYDGTQTRISPQGYFYSGSFGALAEYVIADQELARNVAATDTTPAIATEGSISNTAWQVVTSYVLTGEDASYKGVKPKKPFVIGEPGWGAFEVAARIGELEADDAAVEADKLFVKTAVQSIQNIGLGVNWYLNSNVKAVLNYNLTSYEAYSGTDPDDDKSIFARLQLSF
ncbi:MAG TPA: porin [Fontimonas sp.]